MGKSTISMAIFNSYVTNYQRLTPQLLLITISAGNPSSLLGWIPIFVASRSVLFRCPFLPKNPPLIPFVLQNKMMKSQFLFIRNGEIPVLVTRAEPPGGPGGRWKWERQSQALDLEKKNVFAGKIGDPILRVDTWVLCDEWHLMTGRHGLGTETSWHKIYIYI